MAAKLTVLGFDADDTLWENEQLFALTQERFAELLADYAPADHLMDHLLAAERRNLGQYGFGIKGFVLSMIETAIDVTDKQVPGAVIHQLIQAGQDMLRHPLELLPGVRDTLQELAKDYQLVLITKGDLLDQERKLAQSNLGDLFCGVEILSDKTVNAYDRIFTQFGNGPASAMMVGNSLKSDVIPALEAGAWGVHVPHDLNWALEHDTPPLGHPRYRQIGTLGQLGNLLTDL